jgi:cell wall-associated NlpC family hydrolase
LLVDWIIDLTARDARLHAFRSDLADARLKGEVAAERFVTGRPARITASVADLRKAPRPDAGVNTQALFGDDVLVFEDAEGWAWVQTERDGYVGYVADNLLGQREHAPTHIVSVQRTFLYPGPDLRFPINGQLSMGSTVTAAGSAETRGTHYALLPSGQAIIASHLRPIGELAEDYVTVAESFLGTPYLWGGASGFGIDCSGLVQLSMRMAGRQVLRDSDMQAASIGTPIEPGPDYSGLQRGDLVFWKGHVAIMTDAKDMIHANGHTMLVSREGLKEAVERIGYLYGDPTGFRRP